MLNKQDIDNFKEYLDRLSGTLPAKAPNVGRGRPAGSTTKELESPREDILADVEKMIEEGKSQQDIIKYLRGLGFVFILTEDFLFHFPGFEFNKKDVGEKEKFFEKKVKKDAEKFGGMKKKHYLCTRF